ncbi:MAG: ABC transporter substrate-binding protein [Firmicutes bacterium]|nr:ABC transporter substrate-binding protein [Bacillota bacterium]
MSWWRCKSIRKLGLGLLLVVISVAVAGAASEYREAPMLQERVQKGGLPPVEERIPKEPFVVEPIDEIGKYGGVLRRAYTGPGDTPNFDRFMRDGLIRWTPDGSDFYPNLLADWELSPDGRTFRFELREGLKWSDGHPFTTEDIMFWFNDIILNEELTPVVPAYLKPGGEIAVFTQISDMVFEIEFAIPNPLFVEHRFTEWDIHAPKHYLQQFHPKYADPAQLAEEIKKAGVDTWYNLFDTKTNNYYVTNPDHPTLYAWKVAVPMPADVVVFERNPYYWKVDTEGNQLPYIDYVEFALVSDSEILNLKAVAGEIDMQARNYDFTNFPLFRTNEERGGYRTLLWPQGDGTTSTIYLNQTVDDDELRVLFQDLRFRRALSHAIDREEINEAVYYGQGTPRQASPIPQSAYFSERWESAYVEYDPQLANELLDELGLARGSDSFRQLPSGEPLHLQIDFRVDASDWLEIVSEQWGEVGIQVTLRPRDRTLFDQRVNASEHQVLAHTMNRMVVPFNDPRRLILCPYWQSRYAEYYESGGASGWKPEGDIAKIHELWDRMQAEPDPQRRHELGMAIIDLHADNIWMIGIVGLVPQPVIVKNNLRNVPEKAVYDTVLRSPSNTCPEQYFFGD